MMDPEKTPPRSRDEILKFIDKEVEKKRNGANGNWIGEGKIKPISEIRDVFGGWLTAEQLAVINHEVRHQYMTVEEAHIAMCWTGYPFDRLEFMAPMPKNKAG